MQAIAKPPKPSYLHDRTSFLISLIFLIFCLCTSERRMMYGGQILEPLPSSSGHWPAVGKKRSHSGTSAECSVIANTILHHKPTSYLHMILIVLACLVLTILVSMFMCSFGWATPKDKRKDSALTPLINKLILEISQSVPFARV